MLTLYNFGPGANSLKPLLALYEKGLEFTPRYLDPTRFEQHEDWYKKINPNGQVPALDHDGRIVTESTVICEYLEDVFTDAPPLRPGDPYLRAQMRIWTKWVDEYFCWCVSTIGWERRISRIARNGFDPKVLEEEMRKIDYSIKKLEARLKDHRWLAGDEYSLADICNFAIAHAMDKGFPEFVNDKATPGIMDWLARIHARPAVKAMYTNAPVREFPPEQKPPA